MILSTCLPNESEVLLVSKKIAWLLTGETKRGGRVLTQIDNLTSRKSQ